MAVWTVANYLLRLSRGLAVTKLTGPMRRDLVLRVYQRMATARAITPSATSMLAQLRSAGLGIRRQDLLRIHKEFKRAGVLGARIQVMGPTARPLKAVIPEWPGFMSRRYLYEFTMKVHDYKSDQWIDEPYRWSSNRIYSKTGAEREITNWWRESGFSKDVDLSSVHFKAVWKNRVQ